MAYHFSRPPQTNYRYIIYRNPSHEKKIFDEFVFKNVVVFHTNQRKRIKSEYVKIKSEVWKIEFDKCVPDR